MPRLDRFTVALVVLFVSLKTSTCRIQGEKVQLIIYIWNKNAKAPIIPIRNRGTFVFKVHGSKQLPIVRVNILKEICSFAKYRYRSGTTKSVIPPIRTSVFSSRDRKFIEIAVSKVLSRMLKVDGYFSFFSLWKLRFCFATCETSRESEHGDDTFSFAYADCSVFWFPVTEVVLLKCWLSSCCVSFL